MIRKMIYLSFMLFILGLVIMAGYEELNPEARMKAEIAERAYLAERLRQVRPGCMLADGAVPYVVREYKPQTDTVVLENLRFGRSEEKVEVLAKKDMKPIWPGSSDYRDFSHRFVTFL